MERDYFLFSDKKTQIESTFVKDGWVTIYEDNHADENDQTLIYCCIVDSQRIKSYKLDSNWVIHPGREGKPAVLGTFENEKWKTVYQTHSEKGIEPFVFWKQFTFAEGHDSYLDISEEFVLYFKLYEKGANKQNRKYYFIDEVGDLDEVVNIETSRIKIKLKYLIEYISVRMIHFSICFDFMRFKSGNFEELNIKPNDENFKTENCFYNHLIRPIQYIKEDKYQSWIHGKAIINFEENKINSYHFDNENEKYETYITGYDKKGNEILLDCEKTNEKAFVVTYFKKDVLNKYYNEPLKYKVDGFSVRSNFISLKIDNNIANYVAVFLVDLGMLPYKEQLHWKQYNIPPQDGISNTYFKTMIEGSWSEHPETPDLFFKNKYQQFNKNWESKFGWKFYKELASEDQYIFTSLHIPTSNNVKTFCEQILSLIKITIDRLNEAEIQKFIMQEQNDKGIMKLEKFLKFHNIEIPEMILFLKNLWHLRSGLLAHSFSKSNKDCKRAIEYFGIRDDNYVAVANDIFLKSIYTMNTLENRILEVGGKE